MLPQQAGSCSEPAAKLGSSTAPSFLGLRPAVVIAMYLISLTWLYHVWSYLCVGDKQLLPVKHDRSDWWGSTLILFVHCSCTTRSSEQSCGYIYIISVWIMPLVNTMACLQSFDYSSHPKVRYLRSLQKKTGRLWSLPTLACHRVNEPEREVQVLISDRVEGWHVPTDYYFFSRSP